MLGKIERIYREYSPKYWTLILASFIDRLGGALIFPFFALYVTDRFDVGMVEVGKMFAIFAVSGMVGSVLGGALTDKFGRRAILLFGLVFSALGSVLMGLVDRLNLFFVLAAFVGVLGDIAGPAHQAMVADLVPEEDKRAEAYGVLRVVANLAVTIGPGHRWSAGNAVVVFAAVYHRRDLQPDHGGDCGFQPAGNQAQIRGGRGEGKPDEDFCRLLPGHEGRGFHGFHGGVHSDGDGVYANEQHIVGILAGRARCVGRRVRVYSQLERGDGGAVPVLGDPQDRKETADAGDGCWNGVLSGRFPDVRVCVAVCDVPAGDGDHHDWRDAGSSGIQFGGCQSGPG